MAWNDALKKFSFKNSLLIAEYYYTRKYQAAYDDVTRLTIK